jgi:hypothetical protein
MNRTKLPGTAMVKLGTDMSLTGRQGIRQGILGFVTLHQILAMLL